MAMLEIAVASADDVQRMAGWAADEGWNPGNSDAQAFFATDPGGFLVGRLDGEPVTCISVVKYGQGFGFLGFYIARPAVRGKAMASSVWNAGMARLAGRNVGLDGVPAQQANYRKSGFRLAWNNVRYEGVPVDASRRRVSNWWMRAASAFDKLAAYDRRFFPQPRDSLPRVLDFPARARGDGGAARRRAAGLRRHARLPRRLPASARFMPKRLRSRRRCSPRPAAGWARRRSPSISPASNPRRRVVAPKGSV